MIPAPVPDLNRLLMDNLALVVGVMGAAIIVLVIVAVLQSRRLRRTADAYRALVSDNKGVSLQQLLNSHLGKVVEIGARMEELTKVHEALEARSRGSLQHIGMVRFNPFEDTGSDQSFAIALLDDRRDGIVLSSLHGRGQTRVFAKPVEGGESKHALSDEEAQAIRIAVDGARSTTSVG
jgi:adenylate cyclase